MQAPGYTRYRKPVVFSCLAARRARARFTEKWLAMDRATCNTQPLFRRAYQCLVTSCGRLILSDRMTGVRNRRSGRCDVQIKTFVERDDTGFHVTIRSKTKHNPKSRRTLIVQDGFASQEAAASWAEDWISHYRKEQKARRLAARRESRLARAVALLEKKRRKQDTSDNFAGWLNGLPPDISEHLFSHLTLPERRDFDLWQRKKTERHAEAQSRQARMDRYQEEQAAMARAARLEEKRRLARLAPADRVLQGARSAHSLARLRILGFTPTEIQAVSEWRQGAMALTKAAEYLGIPRGRLDRWEREGIIAASFHRRCHITGKGRVLKRMWRPADLDALAQRLDGLAWRSTMQKKAVARG